VAHSQQRLTAWRTVEVWLPVRLWISVFLTASTLLLGHTQTPVRLGPGALFLAVRGSMLGVNNWPKSPWLRMRGDMTPKSPTFTRHDPEQALLFHVLVFVFSLLFIRYISLPPLLALHSFCFIVSAPSRYICIVCFP